MKTLLAILLITGGVSYFNYKSKTELEGAKCELTKTVYGFTKMKYDYYPSAENEDQYARVMLKLVENCTLIEVGEMIFVGTDVNKTKKEYSDKLNRFLENTK